MVTSGSTASTSSDSLDSEVLLTLSQLILSSPVFSFLTLDKSTRPSSSASSSLLRFFFSRILTLFLMTSCSSSSTLPKMPDLAPSIRMEPNT